MSKKILLTILSVAFVVFSFAQETGCISGDCTNGFGTYVLTNGDKYVGNWNDGIFHGNGTYYFATGDKYGGNFKAGLMEGDGTFYYADNSKYLGQFKAGVWHGKGEYYDESGKLAQKGVWANNVYQEEKSKCRSGNCLNGKGLYIIHNDKYKYYTYEGDFVDGKYYGEGILLQESKGDGFVTIGNTLNYKYVGGFVRGNKSGYGVETDYNYKLVYKGNWISGQKNGKGKQYDLKGNLLKEGNWKYGKFVD